MKVVSDYKQQSDDLPAKYDVLADCIVKLSAEDRRHFIDYNQVETETAADLDSSAYGINANALKAHRPKDLEADQVFVFDMIETELARTIKSGHNELAKNKAAA